MQDQIMISVRDVKKQYRLGQIGGGTLRGDLQSWWARKRGREDPNTPIGTDQRLVGTTFMALNGVSFTVKKGEAVGIIGANGAGKSTLLKLLTHVTAPTAGDIDLYGRVASMLEVGTGFHGEMTGRENVYLNGAILGMTRAEIDSKMDQIIAFSECGDFIDTPVKRYSSGMYVKLAFSVAAHLDSEIMIMDEVLAVGDIKFQQKCLTKMRQAATEQGRTVLYVSHNMNTIRQLCDRCIVLNKGKIIFEGDVSKAVEIYLGHDKDAQRNKVDFEKVSRPGPNHGKKLRLHSLEFVGIEDTVFDATRPLQMRITLQAMEDLPDLYMWLEMKSTDGMIVGMAQTLETFGSVKKDHTYAFEALFDVSNLADGTYLAWVDIYSRDDAEGHVSYDHPTAPVTFTISRRQPHGVRWERDAWGSVMLNDLIPLKENTRSKDP